MKKRLKTIALIVIPLLLLLILGIVVMGVGGGLISYFSGVLFIATAINHQTGLNMWLARLIAIPFLVAGYYYGVRLILFHKKKRHVGYITLMVVLAVICVSMFATQGAFSRKTGEALKYYYTDERGQIVLRDHDGTDAETGAKLQKVTSDIMRQYRLQEQGVLKVTSDTLFDPNTGEALKRYYQAEDGTITLFALEVQFHPKLGTKLALVTPEIAVQYAEQPGNSPRSIDDDGMPIPVDLVLDEPQGTPHEATSPEAIATLNQEYQQRVQNQLETTHEQNEQASQEEFENALNDGVLE
jgi:hypothetical protein